MTHVRPFFLPRVGARLFVLAALVLACDGGDPVDPGPDDDGGIGPEGGTFSSADGDVTIVVPAGALSDSVQFSAAEPSTFPADPGLIAGTVFRIEPESAEFDPPAELSIRYDPARLPAGADESLLRLYRAEAGAWVPLGHVAVDAAANRVRAQIDGLGTFAILLRSPVPDTGSATAYIVDPPLNGSVRYFTEVAPAFTYVCSLPPDTVPHVIVVRTSRALNVGRLAYACDVELRRDPAYVPSFRAPQDSLMHIEAQGALVLSNMAISAPAGLLIQAAARFVFNANTVDGETTIEVVEAVAGGPARAASAAAWAAGGEVSGNSFGQNFNLNFDARVDADVDYTLSNNAAPEISVGGDAALGGSAHLDLGANLVDGIRLDVTVDAEASIDVHGHASLALVDGAIEANGDHHVDFRANAVADAKLTIDGVGSATLRLQSNDIANGDFRFSLADLQLNSTGDVFGDLIVGLGTGLITAPRLQMQQNGGAVNGEFQLLSLGVPGEGAHLGLTATGTPFRGPVTARLETGAQLDFLAGTRLEAGLNVQATTPGLVGVNTANANVQGDFAVVGKGGAKVGVRGVASTFLRGGIVTTEATGILYVDLGGAIASAPFFFGRGSISPTGEYVPSTTAGAATAGTDTIIVENAIIDGGGNYAISLFDIEGDVLISGGTMTSAVGAVWMDNVAGDVTVENVHMIGGGVSVDSVLGAVVIRNDTLQQTATLGFSVAHSPSVLIENVSAISSTLALLGVTSVGSTTTVRNSTFTGQLFAAMLGSGRIAFEGNSFSGSGQIQVGDTAVLTATGNTFTGILFMVHELGYLTLTGNTFAGGFVNDFLFGGLLTDPVGSNPGLDPDATITTLVDFDGNGCAEYPTGYNQKDPDTGLCGFDGIPPRSAP